MHQKQRHGASKGQNAINQQACPLSQGDAPYGDAGPLTAEAGVLQMLHAARGMFRSRV